MPPPCSLLIPCHNAASFLPRLWKTVGVQRPAFAEVIVYDDASTDNTGKVARGLGAEVIEGGVQSGPAVARNRLCAAAKCDWVHFHDADDWMHEEYLARMGSACREEVDVVACDADWVDEQTGVTLLRWRYQQEQYAADPLSYFLTHPLGVNNCLYRRAVFQHEGGFRPQAVPWEDADLHLRLAAAGRRFVFLNQVLTRSLRHPAGISMNYRRNWQSRLWCLENYLTSLPAGVHGVLAAEFEQAAVNLLLYGDRAAARQALAFCRQLGRPVPTTGNPVLKALRCVLPGWRVLWLQQLWRRRQNQA